MDIKTFSPKYGIVVCYQFSNEWKAMEKEKQRDFEMEHVFPLFSKYAMSVKRRSFDADAFSVICSDFMFLETDDIKSFYYLVEELRDSQLLARGYASISQILVGVDNSYKLPKVFDF